MRKLSYIISLAEPTVIKNTFKLSGGGRNLVFCKTNTIRSALRVKNKLIKKNLKPIIYKVYNDIVLKQIIKGK